MTLNTILNILFVPAVLLAGFLAASSDIKTGKVRNSLIKKGFYYGLIVYSLLFIWTIARKYSGFLSIFFGKTYYIDFNYFVDLSINTIIALIVGVILWKLNFWAAGDAKLFALFSFLVPLIDYSRDKIIYFPSFVLLLNIYIICLFYLIFTGISKIRFKVTDFPNFYNIKKQKIIEFLKGIPKKFRINPVIKVETPSPTAFSKNKESGINSSQSLQGAKSSNWVNKILNFINLAFIYSIIFAAISFFNFKINILKFSLSSQLLVYLGLFLIYKPLSKLINNYPKINFFIFPVLIISGFFIPNVWKTILMKISPLIRFFGGFLGFFVIIKMFVKILSQQTETKKIKLDDLQPNMLLGEETINLLKQDKEFFQKELEQMYFDGLSIEQVEKIKTFVRTKNLDEIEIYKTFPFAPFIFAGAITTLILQGSFLNWLTQFLR